MLNGEHTEMTYSLEYSENGAISGEKRFSVIFSPKSSRKATATPTKHPKCQTPTEELDVRIHRSGKNEVFVKSKSS